VDSNGLGLSLIIQQEQNDKPSLAFLQGVPCINNVNKCSISTKLTLARNSLTQVAMPLKLERSILSAQQVDADHLHRRHGPHARLPANFDVRKPTTERKLAWRCPNSIWRLWVGKYQENKDSEMINVTYQGDTLMTAYKGYGGSPMYPRDSFFTVASLTHSSRHHHEGPDFGTHWPLKLRNSGAA
jgi:hypothetical protein